MICKLELDSLAKAILLIVVSLPHLCANKHYSPHLSPNTLQIVIVEGDAAINNIRTRTARETIVEVRDHDNLPVSQAAVKFTIPKGGPGGTFGNGSNSLKVMTDQQGRAIATGLKPNNVAGAFKIKVNAAFEDKLGENFVTQTNVYGAGAGAAPAGGISKAAIWLIAGGAAAGGVAAAVAAKGGNSGTSTSTNTDPPQSSATIGASGPPVLGPAYNSHSSALWTLSISPARPGVLTLPSLRDILADSRKPSVTALVAPSRSFGSGSFLERQWLGPSSTLSRFRLFRAARLGQFHFSVGTQSGIGARRIHPSLVR